MYTFRHNCFASTGSPAVPRWRSPRPKRSVLIFARSFVQSALCRTKPYEETIPHLGIGSHTRVIFQGFTGRLATQNARQSLDYGTKIVGGVTPGRGGEHLGLPVFATVQAAKDRLKPDATAVYVAAEQAAGAIEEAIEAEIPLIVAVAEHVPTIDLLRIRQILDTQSRCRLVGPNSPGIISAVGKCRIGFQPLPCFQPGVVGIAARSGTLSYEAVASTTRAGLGQSLVVGVGGDILPGTDFVDVLTLFEHHEETKGIVLIGEMGGHGELWAAEWIREYRKRTQQPKPIMALIAGSQALKGTVMGHAGAFVHHDGSGNENANYKYRALQDAGVVMVNHPSKFGDYMKQMLDDPDPRKRQGLSAMRSMGDTRTSQSIAGTHGRKFHNAVRRPRTRASPVQRVWRRDSHFLSSDRSLQFLHDHALPVAAEQSTNPKDGIVIRLDIDRTMGRLCATVIADERNFNHQLADHENSRPGSLTPLSELFEAENQPIDPVLRKYGSLPIYFRSDFPRFDAERRISQDPTRYLPKLLRLFVTERAFHMDVRFRRVEGHGYGVVGAQIGLDALVYEGPKDLEEQQTKTLEELSPVEAAAKEGIVYVKLDDPQRACTIGTIVNGAGLSLNTVDAIHALGGACANFLDTGGKATPATVARSLRLVLADVRVQVVFVNIFGGLTRCGVIAEGVVGALREVGVEKEREGRMGIEREGEDRGVVPVVVRLKGTEEEEGREVIANSNLPHLHFHDDFEEAARTAMNLAAAAATTKTP